MSIRSILGGAVVVASLTVAAVRGPEPARGPALTVEQQRLLSLFSIEQLDDGLGNARLTVRLTGANFQVVSGGGATAAAPNGVGNVIIGYDEFELSSISPADIKTGSHMLVLGENNDYRSYGGLMSGRRNQSTAPFGVVLGGQLGGTLGADSFGAVTVGGRSPQAQGRDSVVVGGFGGQTLGFEAVSVGGSLNRVDAASTALGGTENLASGGGVLVGGVENRCDAIGYSVLVGGYRNVIDGEFTNLNSPMIVGGAGNHAESSGIVLGGVDNSASMGATLVGGVDNTGSALHAVVVGGEGNSATEIAAVVSGGRGNAATGAASTVSGGVGRFASGEGDWVAGSLFEDN